MRPEFIIAEKEFRDQIASKRFLIILAILLLLSAYAVVQGMDSYHTWISEYNKNPVTSNPHTQNTITELQKQIQAAEAAGNTQEAESLRARLDSLANPPMPSVLIFFSSMVLVFSFVGMILGAALGFDEITRERDEGSLKSLVSCPIYRDAILAGKMLGATITLASALGIMFLLTISIVLIKGVVPSADDLLRILAFFLVVLLYCMVFFTISLAMSALTRTTSTAIIGTIGIVFLLIMLMILSTFISDPIAGALLGPEPDIPASEGHGVSADGNYSVTEDNYAQVVADADNSSIAPGSEYGQYALKKSKLTYQILDTTNIICPIYDFGGMFGSGIGGIGSAILTGLKPTGVDLKSSSMSSSNEYSSSPIDALIGEWMKIFVLVVELIIAFAVAYLAFMRSDIR